MQRKWTKIRRLSQIIFLILFVVFLWRAIYPVQGIKGARIFFAIDPLIAVGVSIAGRVFLKILLPALILLVLTAVFGRFFCGWVCPLGVMIDFTGYLRGRFNRIKKREIYRQPLRFIKFALLAIMILLALFGIQAVWWGDPITIAGRFISMNFIPVILNFTETVFKLVLKIANFPEFLLSVYRAVNGFIGGVRSEYFPNAPGIFMFWLSVMLITALSRRFWCRTLCPLGAMLALAAKLAPFKRTLTRECTYCRKCISDCRMGAIKKDSSYYKEECILCMDCVYDCPAHAAVFSFRSENTDSKLPDNSRRNFLKFIGMSSLLILTGARKGNRYRGGRGELSPDKGIIRPPGALKEKDFVNRCVRCGNCMRVCVTNGLQPVIMEAGLSGIWTPKLVPEIGGCEYLCTMCSKVCPTGAIPKLGLKVKKMTRLGTAGVHRNRCIPWRGEAHCIVCEEHCPVEEKAIKLIEDRINGETLLKPVVDKGLCIGCGTCQHVCPVRPLRAIIVNPSSADRI